MKFISHVNVNGTGADYILAQIVTQVDDNAQIVQGNDQLTEKFSKIEVNFSPPQTTPPQTARLVKFWWVRKLYAKGANLTLDSFS